MRVAFTLSLSLSVSALSYLPSYGLLLRSSETARAHLTFCCASEMEYFASESQELDQSNHVQCT